MFYNKNKVYDGSILCTVKVEIKTHNFCYCKFLTSVPMKRCKRKLYEENEPKVFTSFYLPLLVANEFNQKQEMSIIMENFIV